MASHVPSVGHDVLDAQHEAIASLLELTKKRVAADDLSGTAGALAALWDEAVGHFTLEEALMEKFSYPELVAHRAAHQLFLEDLKCLIRELGEGGLTAEVRNWACQRVPDWVTSTSRRTTSCSGAFSRGGSASARRRPVPWGASLPAGPSASTPDESAPRFPHQRRRRA